MAVPQRQKYQQYKVYSPTGTYLGQLQNVSSDFTYNQTLSSAAVQTQITVEQSADVVGLASTPILDEQSNAVTDEASNTIYDEGVSDIIGSTNSKALIANNNLIKIYEISPYNTNGKLVFSGYISKWKATFGGTNDILITAISLGQDMGNYIVQSGDSANTTQAVDDGTLFNVGTDSPKAGSFYAIAQTFTVPSSVSIGAVTLTDTPYNLGSLLFGSIYQMLGTTPNPQNDTLIASGQVTTTSASKTAYKIGFTPVTLNSGITYYIYGVSDLLAGSSTFSQLSAAASNPYANGQVYQLHFNGASWDTPTGFSSDDLVFTLWQHGGNVTSTYTNVDPSFILTDIMNNYIAQGGQVSIPPGGYTNTGITTSYKFKQQTVLQALSTVLSLSPVNWYWYVDPATNILYFQQASTTADITLIKGRHINELDIEATRENIKNVVYFTGGDDGTGTSTNILVLIQNALAGNRVGLAQLSDNRVNSTTGSVTTARLIAQEYANNNNAETYITNVTVEDNTMDISLFTPGKMVALASFSPFVNSLLLQVVGINRSSDQVIAQLGTLPITASQAVAYAQAQLAYLQTVANPTVPS